MVIKIREYQEKLLEGVKKLVETKSFVDFLRFSSKFRKYSFGNVLLIWTQRPDATQVAGMKTWNALGRTVKKGEKGIMIFAPFLKKVRRAVDPEENSGPDVNVESLEKTRGQEAEAQKLVGFKSVYVFDVSQTEGNPLPELEVGKPSMDDDGDAEELFRKILKASPVPVDYEEIVGSSNGYYMPKERKIVLSNALTEAQRCKTLLHELAHYLSLDPANASDFSRSYEELIAEGAAYIVSAHFGLDSSDYSVPYVASWAGGELKEILSVGEKMRKVSERLIELVEPSAVHGKGQANDAA